MLKWYDTGAVSGSVLPEPYVTPTGKVDKTTMGISHEYHSAHARPAQRRGKSVFILRLAGTAAAILLISAAVTAVLQHGGPEQAASVPVQPSGTAQEILAPLPMQGQGQLESRMCSLEWWSWKRLVRLSKHQGHMRCVRMMRRPFVSPPVDRWT